MRNLLRKHATWIRILIVPTLLIGLSCFHYYRWSVHQQSSWGSGCGFGMFATVDYHGSRFYRCYVESSDGRLPAEFSPAERDLEMLCRVNPSHRNLQKLADRMLSRNWYRVTLVDEDNPDLTIVFASLDPNGDTSINKISMIELGSVVSNQRIDVKQIHFEIWGIEIDQFGKRIQSNLIRTVSLPRESDNDPRVAEANDNMTRAAQMARNHTPARVGP